LIIVHRHVFFCLHCFSFLHVKQALFN